MGRFAAWWRRRLRPASWGDLLGRSAIRVFGMLLLVAVVVQGVEEALRRLLVPDLPGAADVLVGALWLPLLLAVPMWRLVVQPMADGYLRSMAEMEDRERTLEREARRLDFDAQLHTALEMADTEPDVIGVADMALDRARGDGRAQLLLTDGHGTALDRPVDRGARPDLNPCDVRGIDACPAIRRGAVTTFPDSEDLDTCPRLRGRNDVPVTATCAPVVVVGSAMGVVHTVAPRDPTRGERRADRAMLTSVAHRVGAQLTMVRLLREVTEQAATDELTGLANRRRLGERYEADMADGGLHTLALCDLDHFKQLNDTHGHDVGDRALRLFADVLRESLRPGDLASRFGGEEFALLLPDCPVDKAGEVAERVRTHLAETLARSELPSFTVSIGLADTGPEPDHLAGLIHRADEALYAAKAAGRDRVQVAARQRA